MLFFIGCNQHHVKFFPGGKLKVVLHNTKVDFGALAPHFDNARSIFLQAANFSASVCISCIPCPPFRSAV